jgi:phospholipid-binding lipoprotein MlaA
MRVLFSIVERTVALALAVTLSACAASGPSIPSAALVGSKDTPDKPKSTTSVTAPTDIASLPGDATPVSDPFEKMNRSTFERNMRFNHSVIYPAAKVYHNIVPEPVRNSIENFVTNLNEPFVFANDVLQLRPEAAVTTVGRFAVNSTVGVGGLFDVATKQKLPQQSGDFGQTLYVWGMRNSPYLVLPVIGPSNVRDLIGMTVEVATAIPLFASAIPAVAASAPAGSSLPHIATAANNISMAGSVATPFTKLDQADQMAELEDGSIDFYSMLRSVVNQKRQAELDEAVQTSGWTGHAGSAGGGAGANQSIAPTWQVKVPKTKEQDLVANAFQGVKE